MASARLWNQGRRITPARVPRYPSGGRRIRQHMHPYSNGPTEGAVNRLKTIKRQMYGRANFDLLRIRVLSG